MPTIKIASGDLINTSLLRHVAKLGLPMIVSTGGGTMMDVRRAYDVIMTENQQLCFLQCTASYPPNPEEMNLRVIETYRRTFPDIVVGLSDHTVDDLMAVSAFTLGARIIEKHFTLDRTMKGSDHALSLDPEGMKAMVSRLAFLRRSMGDGVKCRYPSEEKGLAKMAKSLVASTSLPVGHVITPKDLTAKTPPCGCPPYELENFLGQELVCPIKADDPITGCHIGRPEKHPLHSGKLDNKCE